MTYAIVSCGGVEQPVANLVAVPYDAGADQGGDAASPDQSAGEASGDGASEGASSDSAGEATADSKPPADATLIDTRDEHPVANLASH